ncbi:MAG: class I SAM-dependent methyltransferase [Actinomycetota bacterium]|nr:class I SAM-dependent methyltransferase [Actinomycetota bacterium]
MDRREAGQQFTYGPIVEERQDAYGELVVAYLEGQGRVREIVERDDGFIEATDGPAGYFAPVRAWPFAERRGLRFIRGRVLDVGCGAGRVALELQARGREVVAIDVSPLTVEVARRRGVHDVRVMAFEKVGRQLGRFDTVVMYGNNFGLFGGKAKAERLLGHLRPLAKRIVASTRDPYDTEDEAHLAYHERNRRRGRMAGQLRLRVRYRDYASAWFDYLIVSPEELEVLVGGTGWRVSRVIEGDPLYVAVLE